MRIKKINAILALLTMALLLAHGGYQIVSYILYFYNPVITKVLGGALATAYVLHAVLSMYIVFKVNDTVKITYRKRNIRTLIQRDTGMLSMLLFFFHAEGMMLLGKTAGTGWFYVMEFASFLFIMVLMVHVSISFSKAFVTLGLITDEKKVKVIDNVMAVICAVFFVVSVVVMFITFGKLFASGEMP